MSVVAPLAAQTPLERVETFADGSVRERCGLDAAGRPHGLYERFAAPGVPALRGTYRAGQRHGQWTVFDAAGRRTEIADYRDDQLDGRRETSHGNGRRAELTSWRKGVLHGPYEIHDTDHVRLDTGAYRDGQRHGERKITAGRKTLTRQQWVDGELTQLDGFRPFPVRQADLRSGLATILAPPTAAPSTDVDPLAPARATALRRLQAYRFLCRVPHEGMSLVPEWNDLCDAAAEACRRNGGLSHDPPRPAGMDDDRYRKAKLGASRSNLSSGGMLGSVDSYMDDSDPSNIDRVGHRRWCLNPTMRKTAFGQDGSYSAMWSMDGSGSPPRDLDAVCYPPAGWTPVSMFGARHAWSLSPLAGGNLKPADVRVSVRRLDDDWLPAGEPLALDHFGVAPPGYGTGPCLVFRPVGVRNEPGERFLVEISSDAGKSVAWRYVVALCE